MTQALVGIVLAINVQCALLFLATPEMFALSYELSGEAGVAAIRGFGVLFLMWNVPYAFAVWRPTRGGLWQIVLMQTLGLVGESFILLSLSPERVWLRESLWRFIAFDGGGLVLLLLALAFYERAQKVNHVRA